ncbi:hypothetical protein L1887_43931 [Cichorium endivia]|nr:hypothetical protein L1887_43931 [Cichorium endivia]
MQLLAPSPEAQPGFALHQAGKRALAEGEPFRPLLQGASVLRAADQRRDPGQPRDVAVGGIIHAFARQTIDQLLNQRRDRQRAAFFRQRRRAGLNKQIVEMRVPGRFGAVRDPAGDPDGAVRRHDPDVILRVTANRAVSGNNQLALAVGMHRHFRGVVHEVQMTRHRRAGGRVGVIQRSSRLRLHDSGNI